MLSRSTQGETGNGAIQIEVIPIHFDVPGHQIPLATFVQTSQQTEAVLRGLSKELFGGEVQFDLVVLPPEEGSFLTRLGIVLGAGMTLIWGFAESDIGQAFIKGLTDHEPAYWAETLGRELKTSVADPTERQPAAVHEYETLILSEMTKSFLLKDTADLERIGITPRGFRDAFEAKNEFYQVCSETRDLRAVGFNEEPIFPIPRENFVRLQTPLPPEEDEIDHPWFVATAILKVTSPNWNRADRARQWKGRDQHGRDRYFRIDDEEFWRRASAGAISTHIIDVMKAQWAFQGGPDQPKNCRVLRVLEFNGSAMSEPFSDEELEAELGRLGDHADAQWDLFGTEARVPSGSSASEHTV